MAGQSKGKRPGAAPEMNVTPLVDVTLVLLIIFMVVAPAINEGEALNLPPMVAFDKSVEDKQMDPIEVTLAANGTVIVDKDRVLLEQLEPRLRQLHAEDAERRVLLKTDINLPYAKIRELLQIFQRVGFGGVQLKVLERKKPGEPQEGG